LLRVYGESEIYTPWRGLNLPGLYTATAGEHEIVLRKNAIYDIYVVDENGEPIEGEKVYLTPYGGTHRAPRFEETKTTDAQGKVRYELIPGIRFKILTESGASSGTGRITATEGTYSIILPRG
jgi:hypothetical protein